jgi:hypothetical protein
LTFASRSSRRVVGTLIVKPDVSTCGIFAYQTPNREVEGIQEWRDHMLAKPAETAAPESDRFTTREDASGLVWVAVDGPEQHVVADVVVKGGEAWVPFSQ